MSSDVRVDVADLRSASGKVGAECTTLSGLHGETAAGVAAARSGWVGSSAAALSQLTSGWQTASTAHSAAIGGHGRHIGASATEFDNTERRNRTDIRHVGDAVDP
jgi:WXG100 family type VII secretion target